MMATPQTSQPAMVTASDIPEPGSGAAGGVTPLGVLHPVDAARFERCTAMFRLHGSLFAGSSLARQWTQRAPDTIRVEPMAIEDHPDDATRRSAA